jgi:HSP20 family protein
MSKKISLQWQQMHGKMTGISNGFLESEDVHSWSPNTDVCEAPDGAVIKMELAGVALEQIDIQMQEHTLVINGVREDPAAQETAAGYRFRQLEIEYGSFCRIITLPYPIDGEQISARLDEGILTIRLRRAPVDQFKRIKINVES